MVNRYPYSLHYLWLMVLALLFFSFSLVGQDLSVDRFSEYPGFPNVKLRASKLDEQGFLWLATDEGIFHFNGESFASFSAPLSQLTTHAFERFPNGDFVAITEKGLIHILPEFEKTCFSFHPSMKIFPEPEIFSQYRTHLIDSSGPFGWQRIRSCFGILTAIGKVFSYRIYKIHWESRGPVYLRIRSTGYGFSPILLSCFILIDILISGWKETTLPPWTT